MSDRQDQFEQLSAYLDGELDADSARRLEEALATDEELRQELAGLRDTRQLLKQVSMQPAPAHFARDVLRKAERHHHLGRGLPGGVFRSVRWIPLAAAAVVLLACGFAMVVIANLPDPNAARIDELALAPKQETPEPPFVSGTTGGALADEAPSPTSPPLPAVADGDAVADVVTEVIYTDDLALAHHSVREVLLTNGLEPVLAEGLPPVEMVNRQANVYNMQAYRSDTIRLEVDVLVDQAPRLRADLARVRSVQTVAQSAPAAFVEPADIAAVAEGPGEDASPEPTAGAVARRSGVDVETSRPAELEPGFYADDATDDDRVATARAPADEYVEEDAGDAMADLQPARRLQRVIVIVNEVSATRAAAAVESEPAGPPSHPPAANQE